MNIPTLYYEEQIIKIHIELLTHTPSNLYLWEWSYRAQKGLDLLTMKWLRNVDFVTAMSQAAKAINKLKNIKKVGVE